MAQMNIPSINPRNVMITTPGVADANDNEHRLRTVAPGGTIIPVQARDFENNAIAAIRAQVQKTGAIPILAIDAHGTSRPIQSD